VACSSLVVIEVAALLLDAMCVQKLTGAFYENMKTK
jgi:hypothetical protein